MNPSYRNLEELRRLSTGKIGRKGHHMGFIRDWKLTFPGKPEQTTVCGGALGFKVRKWVFEV